MKNILVLIVILSISCYSYSQNNQLKNNFVKATGGRIIFGTGDFFGYSANVEYGRFVNIKKHFAFGAELSFEHGSTHPTIINPSIEEFLFGPMYRTATNIAFTPKLTYYPIRKTFLCGINISAGISVAYTSQAREFQATRIFDSVRQTSVRRSYLEFKNEATVGYRITAGYEWFFKKLIVGGRLDFDSYANGDINTFYGLKAGWRF